MRFYNNILIRLRTIRDKKKLVLVLTCTFLILMYAEVLEEQTAKFYGINLLKSQKK